MGRVFVAGSINMDVVATADRHPRVGETVAGQAVLYFPGGKGANQAVAAAKLGAPTTLIGRLGADAFGQQLRTFLAAQGVDLTFVKDTAEAHTGTAIITIANADNTIVVVPGANALVSADDVAAPVLAKGDIAVSQFEIPLPTIAAFFKRARAAGATTILNPAPAIAFGPELLDLVDILILNETELGFLTKTELRDTDDACPFHRSRAIAADRGGQNRLRHAGQARRACAGRRRAVDDSGRAVKAVDTTGAGDCFVGAVAAQLADGKSIHDALEYANAAASICVQRMGAAPSMPTAAEVAALRGRAFVLVEIRPGSDSDAFSLREPVSTSLENAMPTSTPATRRTAPGPAGAGGCIVVQRDRRLSERLAIRLDHGLAELPELAGQNLLGRLDRFRRLCGGFLQRIRKIFCRPASACSRRDCRSPSPSTP